MGPWWDKLHQIMLARIIADSLAHHLYKVYTKYHMSRSESEVARASSWENLLAWMYNNLVDPGKRATLNVTPCISVLRRLVLLTPLEHRSATSTFLVQLFGKKCKIYGCVAHSVAVQPHCTDEEVSAFSVENSFFSYSAFFSWKMTHIFHCEAEK